MALTAPIMVDTPAGVWTKVADNVSLAMIHKQKRDSVTYFVTYRDAAAAAPTTLDDEIMWLQNSLSFSATEPGDVYIYCKGKDGRVRVEI